MANDARANYYTPVFQGRLEYFPQTRIGISLAAGYELVSKTALINDWILGNGTEKRARLDKFYLEPTVSLYF